MTDIRPWAEEDEEVLRQRYTAGQGLDRIAEILGRTPAAVKKKAHRMGLKRPESQERERKRSDLARRLADLQGLSPEA
ncbi:MAG: hypothetical protein LN413_06950, partial [Candidatus Thermoplasmatota archaeon]|nr:hypothetical protein [Candidatus Thermoplasmatota archaeon]